MNLLFDERIVILAFVHSSRNQEQHSHMESVNPPIDFIIPGLMKEVYGIDEEGVPQHHQNDGDSSHGVNLDNSLSATLSGRLLQVCAYR